MSRGTRNAAILLGIIVVLSVGVWGTNRLLVGSLVTNAVNSDDRNASMTVRAHFAYYLFPNELVINLAEVGEASPADLGRVLFQSAEAFHDRGRTFRHVVLAGSGNPVFQIQGADFAELGNQFSYGENPVYMVRKLPSKLFHPDGTQAYNEWSGGLLGVVGREMEDYTDAMASWASEVQ